MNEYSPDDEKRLVSLLEAQKQMMERILELTENQAQLLGADDVDGFNLSLDHRQTAIEEFDRLHQESTALMQSYASVSTASTSPVASMPPDARASSSSSASSSTPASATASMLASTSDLLAAQQDAALSDDPVATEPQTVRKLILAIGEITEKCKILNEKNALEAHAKAEDYSARIGSLGVKRKSLGAYIQNISNNAELFDKKM